MEKVLTVLKYVLYVFLIGCVGMLIWLGLYFALGWSEYTSFTTNYLDKMTYVEEDSKYFIDINYLSNEKNNGIECFEAKLNYYTDTNLPEKNKDGTFNTDKYYYSSGIQFNGGYTYDSNYVLTNGGTKYGKTGWYRFHVIEPTNCFYYNTDNRSDTSFNATNELKDMNAWIYDIDGQLCLIKSELAQSLGTTFVLHSNQVVYDMNYCLLELYDAVKTLDDGIHIITFDLSKYFNILMYSQKTGQFDTPATGKKEWTFVKVKINKDSNGLVSAKQSIFNLFMGDPDWSAYEITDSSYWQIDNVYNLSLNQFTFVYENGGYYLKLQDNVISFLETFNNMYYKLSLDLDNIYLGSDTLDIKGFAKNAFGELNVAEISLTSNTVRTFQVYDPLLSITTTNTITLEVLSC